MSSIISDSKNAAFKIVNNTDKDFGFFDFANHIKQVEQWSKWMLEKYPQADEEVLLISVYWHDVGQFAGTEEDHAVNSTEAIKIYLKDKDLPKDKKTAITHCVRAHRCKDVQPESLEAKLLAWSDSASHFTSDVYLLMMNDDLKNDTAKDDFRALGKIDRDWRDLDLFPEEKEVLADLYQSWHQLIKDYVKIFQTRKGL